MIMTEFPKPNYKVWDDVDIFDQLHVVCLWAEFEPSQEAIKEERCQAIQRLLNEARKEGLLRSYEPKVFSNGKLEYEVRFLRHDLKAYAERVGMKPAFLFKETRTILDAPAPQDNSLPNPDATKSSLQTDASEVSTPLTSDDEKKLGLKRREIQIRAIEKFAAELGYKLDSIPVGGKKKLMEKCKSKEPDLFGAGDSSFDGAWKVASKTGRLQIANKEKYLPRK